MLIMLLMEVRTHEPQECLQLAKKNIGNKNIMKNSNNTTHTLTYMTCVCSQFDMFSSLNSVCVCYCHSPISQVFMFLFSILLLLTLVFYNINYHFSLYLHHRIPLSSLLVGPTVELRER